VPTPVACQTKAPWHFFNQALQLRQALGLRREEGLTLNDMGASFFIWAKVGRRWSISTGHSTFYRAWVIQ
jgi:hypothetical protein